MMRRKNKYQKTIKNAEGKKNNTRRNSEEEAGLK